MKSYILYLFIFFFGLQETYSQLVTTDSYFPNGDNDFTIIFDLKQAKDTRAAGLLGKTSDVYLWSGAGTADNAFEYQPTGQTNFSIPFELGKMTSLGNNRWSIKLKPRDYFKVPADKLIKKLGLLLKSGDGRSQTEDFILDLYDNKLYYKVIEPDLNTFFEENQTIKISLKTSKKADKITFAFNTTRADFISHLDINNFVSKNTDSVKISMSPTPKNMFLQIKSDNEEIIDEIIFKIKPKLNILNLPPNIKDGINYINDNTVTFSFYAPQKSFVYLIGDFNNWQVNPDYLMNQTADGNRYWLTVNNLEKGKEYAFQYYIDYKIAVGDPFCEKILDPKFDNAIPSTTYPNLKSYPANNPFGGTVSVLQTGQAAYEWKVKDFKRPAKENLVIYELLVRDFMNSRRYKEVADSIAYFKRLGINSIELMPINEFTANDSWGYNPTYYTAPDKAYGTKDDLKFLIDKCHENGIAVIFDVVFNHADLEFPYAKAYWNGSQPSADSPFLNQKATHPYSVFFDFNHESIATQAYFDKVLEFWLKEYKIDGYRFDLSKGFTQKLTDPNVGLWSQYDASRIKLLKRFYDKIRVYDKDCYLILEHLAENIEEVELADYGFMLWGNMNGNIRNIIKGTNNSLTGLSYLDRNWREPNLVSYMESHDEERIVYDAVNNGKNEVKNLNTVLERAKAAAALFFAYPGPKMLWQFGEFGYDVNIDFNGRTGVKPQKWEYLKDVNRLKLFKVYAELIKLKTTQAAFLSKDFRESTSGIVKQVALNHPSMNVRIIANFGLGAEKGIINFESTGKWYDYFTGNEINISETNPEINLAAGEFHVFTTVKLPTPEANLVPWQGITTITANEIPIQNSRFQVYPNPTTDRVTLKLNGEKTQISLEDLWGKTLFTTQTKEIEPIIDLSNFPEGMYLIKTAQKGKTRTTKIIKN